MTKEKHLVFGTENPHTLKIMIYMYRMIEGFKLCSKDILFPRNNTVAKEKVTAV